MPPKTKAATKPVTKTSKKPVAKAATRVKKATAVAKKKTAGVESRVRPAAKKVSSKANVRKKSEGLIESVKKGVQTGIDAVGDLVKRMTPEALKPKAKKLKRM